MVLDTSVCVDLMRDSASERHGAAHRALERLGNTPLSISLFTVCELNTGVTLSHRSGEEQRRVTELVQHLTILCPDTGFAVLYGEAAAVLLSAGTPIPVLDLLIGITAKSRGLAVLTRDVHHFKRIPGLVVEGY